MMSQKDNIEDILMECNIPFIANYNLKSNSYSKTGNVASKFIMPKNTSELECLIKRFNELDIPYKVVGDTTNILFLDSVIYSNIISTKLVTEVVFSNNKVEVACGKNLPDFVRELSMRDYTGFEGLEGIPGTIGGGIFMNAGAYGYEISDHLESVKFINPNGVVLTLNKDDLSFDRRTSYFKKNEGCIILSATFNLKVGSSETIYNKIEKYHIARHKYQEWVYPNLGSIYSSNLSIYESSSCKRFYMKFKIVRKLFYTNPIAKYYNRLYPSNKRLNVLFLSHFNMLKYSDFPSKKNINTFVNRNFSTLEIVDYISVLGQVINNETYLENELVLGPIQEITEPLSYGKTIDTYNHLINNSI
ncbi:FAD-binding protein [Vibrio vulnificus]|uniref:FAD-binding protein n=1 Tax=Vibrio vulnificus TaxID=672 RepID=UPI0019D443E9|nr:FAD-binding protein [Vibrio vulnificus]MBN8103428.1 FAD-binding protein [Vibrio vulnificus]